MLSRISVPDYHLAIVVVFVQSIHLVLPFAHSFEYDISILLHLDVLFSMQVLPRVTTGRCGRNLRTDGSESAYLLASFEEVYFKSCNHSKLERPDWLDWGCPRASVWKSFKLCGMGDFSEFEA